MNLSQLLTQPDEGKGDSKPGAHSPQMGLLLGTFASDDSDNKLEITQLSKIIISSGEKKKNLKI